MTSNIHTYLIKGKETKKFDYLQGVTQEEINFTPIYNQKLQQTFSIPKKSFEEKTNDFIYLLIEKIYDIFNKNLKIIKNFITFQPTTYEHITKNHNKGYQRIDTQTKKEQKYWEQLLNDATSHIKDDIEKNTEENTKQIKKEENKNTDQKDHENSSYYYTIKEKNYFSFQKFKHDIFQLKTNMKSHIPKPKDFFHPLRVLKIIFTTETKETKLKNRKIRKKAEIKNLIKEINKFNTYLRYDIENFNKNKIDEEKIKLNELLKKLKNINTDNNEELPQKDISIEMKKIKKLINNRNIFQIIELINNKNIFQTIENLEQKTKQIPTNNDNETKEEEEEITIEIIEQPNTQKNIDNKTSNNSQKNENLFEKSFQDSIEAIGKINRIYAKLFISQLKIIFINRKMLFNLGLTSLSLLTPIFTIIILRQKISLISILMSFSVIYSIVPISTGVLNFILFWRSLEQGKEEYFNKILKNTAFEKKENIEFLRKKTKFFISYIPLAPSIIKNTINVLFKKRSFISIIMIIKNYKTLEELKEDFSKKFQYNVDEKYFKKYLKNPTDEKLKSLITKDFKKIKNNKIFDDFFEKYRHDLEIIRKKSKDKNNEILANINAIRKYLLIKKIFKNKKYLNLFIERELKQPKNFFLTFKQNQNQLTGLCTKI